MPRLTKIISAAEVERFFETLSKHIVPKAELDWETPFDLLMAVVLSAQATDRSVNLVTGRLRKLCPTPAACLEFGQERLEEEIRSIGLFRNKAKSIIGLSAKLIESFNGEVPRKREELESLPGVGRKTANVVLNIAYGEPTLAVDTHVFRVTNRVALAHAKDPLEAERKLLKRVPKRFLVDAHHYLILHGRYTCKARKPECFRCVVCDLCRFPDKTPAADA